MDKVQYRYMCTTIYFNPLTRNSLMLLFWVRMNEYIKKKFYFSNKCHSFYRNFKFMAFCSMAFNVGGRNMECFM